MNGKSNKLKFLVLIDFSQNAYKALKYTISLAKVVNGKIVLLYVASPRNLVKSDNPSIALRSMEIDKSKAEVQLKSIIEMIEAEGITAEYVNTIGNISTKMKEYANLLSPSLIVLGKSSHIEQNLGEVTEHLLYRNNDNVLIIGSDNQFSEDTSISVECNENSLGDYSSNLLLWLNVNTRSPIRFYVNKRKRREKAFSFPENWSNIKNAEHKICYKNNQHFSVANGLEKHLSEENIELVCIGRKRANPSLFSKLFNQPKTILEIIKNTQIPLMLMGKIA